MKTCDLVCGATLGLGMAALTLTGKLALWAGMGPFYAVVASIVVFLAVIWLARWAANALGWLRSPLREGEVAQPRPGSLADDAGGGPVGTAVGGESHEHAVR